MKKLRAPTEEAFLRTLDTLKQYGVEVRTYSSKRWLILADAVPGEVERTLNAFGVQVTDAVQFDMD